jgi:dTDP-4-amino-4,6-dideoxygalactose transaminase
MLDLERQYRGLHAELIQALGHVLDTRQFILGDAVSAFERAAAGFLRIPHALGCSSGTDALWLALAGSGIGTGDSVITTPFSFFASVSAILRAGATPLLADIDPVSFNLSPAAVEARLNGAAGGAGSGGRPGGSSPERVRAILPVHLYGGPVRWDAFARIGRERELVLLEDAAQAWGAEFAGVKVGALGDAAAFSFYPTKNLSAAGDAGMVSTNSDAIAERVCMLRQHGMRERYFHEELGWNARMDGFQGAVLQVKLKYSEQWNEARRTVARRYQALFAKAGLSDAGPYPEQGVVLPREASGTRHVWHQYVIRVQRREALRAFLTERAIGSEIFYPVPLHLQKALEGLGYAEGDFPEAERAAREVLALPMFPELREDEQETVVAAVAEFLS